MNSAHTSPSAFTAPSSQPHAIDRFGDELLQTLTDALSGSTCTHVSHIPPRQAQYLPWPTWVEATLRERLIDRGIQQLYSHQVALAESAWNQQHSIIATGTSSGKSLGYLLPIVTTLSNHPRATALYLTPTKALGNDQLLALSSLLDGLEPYATIHPAPYDGDTPVEARQIIREQSRFLMSNPDMLHAGILPNHQRWQRFFRNLHYLVIDECHTYRGVFGAHVSLVLRRFLRIARHYGANPTVIFASATNNYPAQHAENLIGEPVHAITEDGSPQGPRTVILWEPGFVEGMTGEHDAPVRRASTTEAATAMAALVAEGARTLSFVTSRRNAEIVAQKCKELLHGHGRMDLGARIASYRAGYLAEDRRRLERGLDNGELLGVASTNALELGIDVGGLDAVICAGFPGTLASFWQQAGRAGRRGQSSIVMFIARDEPLDTYLVHHPAALLERPVESIVFDPTNPYILRGHLICAALELPLQLTEVAALRAETLANRMLERGLMRQRGELLYAKPTTQAGGAHQHVSLRGSGHTINIVDGSDGRLLGTVDYAQACSQLHPGAVYLHLGESYVVDELNLTELIAIVHAEAPDYLTFSQSVTDIAIIGEPDASLALGPGIWVSNIPVALTQRVVGYTQKGSDGTILAQIPLQLPEQTLETRAVAYTIDPQLLTEIGIADIPGALHAAEHAAIGLLPLFATCDRWDIGGVSTAVHADTLLPTVFVYDGHPGGAGFADRGYQLFAQWIEATYHAVQSCACESGCPSCVQSPKCGNGNNPLDKQGAIAILQLLCSRLQQAGELY